MDEPSKYELALYSLTVGVQHAHWSLMQRLLPLSTCRLDPCARIGHYITNRTGSSWLIVYSRPLCRCYHYPVFVPLVLLVVCRRLAA